ncbi:MAG: VacJ family lipoprotein [Methylococcaceae bacterium]|nr:VacJ family lipoprotein [Methylococcaceae bacterium]
MTTKRRYWNRRFLCGGLTLAALLSGCAANAIDPNDPWEDWNRSIDSFNDSVDKTILKPMAEGYVWTTPESVDQGVTNFFSNIQDIGVTLNDLLQSKFSQAGMDSCRFLINTTLGIAGVIDVASLLDLHKHSEDFDQTLGVWGIPAGPYLVLPFWGPSSPRGIFGLVGDALMDPLTYTFFVGGSAVAAATLGAAVLDVTDTRAALLLAGKIVDETSVDRYDFLKSSYLQRREYLIRDGNVPDSEEEFDPDENLQERPAEP